MKRDSLRDRLVHRLRQLELRTPALRRVWDGLDGVPLRDLVQFLETTGDEQVEIAKRCLWKLSYATMVFPPVVALRNILSLQSDEKSQDVGASHRSRDHVRHLVYLFTLGIYIYSIDKNLQRHFDRQAALLRRTHGLDNASNSKLFVEAWIPFCIFHDAAYPIERLHSATSGDVRDLIRKQYVGVYQDLTTAYVEEYALRAISNACSLLALLDFDEQSFEQLIFSHLTEPDAAALTDAALHIDPTQRFLETLRTARPISALNAHFARLLARLTGATELVAAVESDDTGEILWIGNMDGSLDVLCRASRISRTDAWRFCFLGRPERRPSYSARFFTCAETLDGRLQAGLGLDASQFADLRQIGADLEKIEHFRRASKGDDAQQGSLPSIAYGALCSSAFLDNSRRNRFEREEAAIATQIVIDQHSDDIMRSTVDSFALSLKERMGDPKAGMKGADFLPARIIANNEPGVAYAALAAEALEFPRLIAALRSALKIELDPSRHRSADGKPSVASIAAACDKAMREKSRNLQAMTKRLHATVKPKIAEEVRRRRAMSQLFAALGPRIREVVDAATGSSEMKAVAPVAEADVNAQDFVRRLFESDRFLRDSELISRTDGEFLKAAGRDFAPQWIADHGFYAGALAFWAASLRWSILKHRGFSHGNLATLMLFHPSARFASSESESALLKASITLAARSIALHNFYPSLAKGHESYRHRVSHHPFSYFALLADTLQNWDREVQYNPGKFDLGELRPDGYYDISFEDDRLQVVVNRRYATEQTVIQIREDLKSYLKDIDTLVQIRLG